MKLVPITLDRLQNGRNRKNFFRPETANPPKCPQVRPIENFWAILKMKVYENDRKARNNADQKKNSALCQKLPSHVCKSLYQNLKRRVRKGAEEDLETGT